MTNMIMLQQEAALAFLLHVVLCCLTSNLTGKAPIFGYRTTNMSSSPPSNSVSSFCTTQPRLKADTSKRFAGPAPSRTWVVSTSFATRRPTS